ncbi:MAG: DUF1127 domain-containing protein [Hahellaceae bacterium]|nr:DUF1127 domain-containing protein [Hahellaceae bacterium]MCP5212792.1 DUF1127 domain-containing protein [Hahellaceae bacterium]
MFTTTLHLNLPKLTKLLSKQRVMSWAKLVVKRIRLAREIAKQRRMLAQLNDSQLKDIGISRYDAIEESNRDFWDIPENQK